MSPPHERVRSDPGRVCLRRSASMFTIIVACDSTEETPKWGGQPAGLPAGVSLRDDGRYYARAEALVTCAACLEWLAHQPEHLQAMETILELAKADGRYAAHPTEPDFALCQELQERGLLFGVQTFEDGLVLFQPRNFDAPGGFS